jgi:hypothetical protein
MSQSGSFGVNGNKSYGTDPAIPVAKLLDRGSNRLGDWVFVKATAAIDQYAWCIVDESGNATMATTTNVNAGEGQIAVAQIALAINEFGWLWIGGEAAGGGVIKGKMAASYVANAAVNTTATAGVADDASTTVIRHVVGTTTDGGSGSAIVLYASGILTSK